MLTDQYQTLLKSILPEDSLTPSKVTEKSTSNTATQKKRSKIGEKSSTYMRNKKYKNLDTPHSLSNPKQSLKKAYN